MSKKIRLKKGFDINLAGKPEKKLIELKRPETFAVKPTDFPHITRPKVLVQAGDNVRAGTPLFYEKTQDAVMYCSPVSGEVVDVKRGEKRKLLEIVVLADKKNDYESFEKFSQAEVGKLDRATIVEQLCKSGVWPQLIQRPFGIVAHPTDEPKAIFISAFDSHPLAPDLAFTLKGQENYFQAGIDILQKLTKGEVHLNVDATAEVSDVFNKAEHVEINEFSGPHPAGNVGIQIHHLDPIAKGEVAWTISPYGVTQIGKLFVEGKYDASKLIAITGSQVRTPAYGEVLSGACVDKVLDDQLRSGKNRIITGNVLTGESIGQKGYLGYYDQQLTVIIEGDEYEFIGWMKPTINKPSVHRAWGLLSFLNGSGKEYVVNTNTNGEPRAFVETGVFEKVLPMDILPTHLIKAIMAEDYDDMEALGIFEIIEEDLALCEFVDVSKHNIQQIVRRGIELVKES